MCVLLHPKAEGKHSIDYKFPPAANENALPEADEEEDNHYTKLYPRCSQVHVVCDGSGEDSGGEEETDGGVTPRQSSLTGSLELGPGV